MAEARLETMTMPEGTGYAATATAQHAEGESSPARSSKEAIRRLGASVYQGWTKLAHLRTRREEYVRMYAGDHFDPDKEDDSKTEWPINRQHRMIAALAANIAANDPIADVQPATVKALRGYATLAGKLMSHRMERCNAKEIERLTILDALMMCGVTTTGIAYDDNWISVGTRLIEVGREYMSRVDPDDYFLDPQCKTRVARLFEGHTGVATRAALREIGLDDEEIDGMPKTADAPRGPPRRSASRGTRTRASLSISAPARCSWSVACSRARRW